MVAAQYGRHIVLSPMLLLPNSDDDREFSLSLSLSAISDQVSQIC